jgi:hypothetical protein
MKVVVSALFAAVVWGCLDYGVPEEPHERLNTALHRAARDGDVSVVQNLLDKGADVDAVDMVGPYADTALMIACRHGHRDVARVLLAAHADPNHREGIDDAGTGETPLMYAARRGDAELTQMLLDAGADVNAVSKLGHTALSNARWNGDETTIDLLLRAGALEN